MNIFVNGVPQVTADGASLAGVLAGLGLSTHGVAVAVNEQVRPRASWPLVVLNEGDQVLIIQPTQGG